MTIKEYKNSNSNIKDYAIENRPKERLKSSEIENCNSCTRIFSKYNIYLYYNSIWRDKYTAPCIYEKIRKREKEVVTIDTLKQNRLYIILKNIANSFSKKAKRKYYSN